MRRSLGYGACADLLERARVCRPRSHPCVARLICRKGGNDTAGWQAQRERETLPPDAGRRCREPVTDRRPQSRCRYGGVVSAVPVQIWRRGECSPGADVATAIPAQQPISGVRVTQLGCPSGRRGEIKKTEVRTAVEHGGEAAV